MSTLPTLRIPGKLNCFCTQCSEFHRRNAMLINILVRSSAAGHAMVCSVGENIVIGYRGIFHEMAINCPITLNLMR